MAHKNAAVKIVKLGGAPALIRSELILLRCHMVVTTP